MTDLIKRLRDQQTKFMTPILGEAAAALERMQWNPDMEAAPKDETILLTDGCTRWMNSVNGEQDIKDIRKWLDGKEATHWMPLPTPPEGE